MSTTTTKRPLAQALHDAEAFRATFPRESYERWEIAGSVRRGMKFVGDVEHVVIPRVGEVAGADLFATPQTANLLWERVDELERAKTFGKHVYGGNGTPAAYRWGERYRGVDFRGACHEIFTADADNWGAQLAIRTGPSTFSKMLVNALQRNGHCNRDGYVWNKNDMACADCGWRGRFADLAYTPPGYWPADEPKSKWINGLNHQGACPSCDRHAGLSMARVSVPDEPRYFELCNLRWLAPSQRIEQPAAPAGNYR